MCQVSGSYQSAQSILRKEAKLEIEHLEATVKELEADFYAASNKLKDARWALKEAEMKYERLEDGGSNIGPGPLRGESVGQDHRGSQAGNV